MLHKFKIFDLVGQLLCVLVPFALWILFDDSDSLFFIYFTVGGWQLISFLISAVTMKAEQRASMRKVYAVLLLLTVLSTVFIGTGAAIVVMYGYVFFTPIMAVMYFIITAQEIRIAASYIERNEFVQKR